MFVIMTYDVGVDRVSKVLKVGRKYLVHIQNSVLEGELSQAQYRALLSEVRRVIREDTDSVRFYVLRTTQYMRVEELGSPRREEGNFL